MFKKIPFLVALCFFLVLSRQELLAREDKVVYEKGQKSKRAAIVFYKKPFVADGISFYVKQVSVLRASAPGLSTGATPNITPVFVVRYKVVNNNQTRKLSVAEPIRFQLKDEFGNLYAQRPPPPEYPGPIQVHEANFPSLYPGESAEDVVFFEPPIIGSKTLFLAVNAGSVGIQDEFIVKVPTKNVEGIEQIADTPKKDESNKQVSPPIVVGPIKIVAPENGAVVEPGKEVHVRVEIGKDSPAPSRVYVIVPSFVLEDSQLELEYDLKVPSSTVGSLAVTVIGKWDLDSGEQVLSDSIVLNIADSQVIQETHEN